MAMSSPHDDADPSATLSPTQSNCPGAFKNAAKDMDCDSMYCEWLEVTRLPSSNAHAAQEFAAVFRRIHMYILLGVFVVAAVCNTSTICVLTRRRMRSPVNCILVAMVVCDSVRDSFGSVLNCRSSSC